MTWFRVDDGFYDHPKVADLPDAAIALWTRAGSWCAKHLTDGAVPTRALRRFCDDPDVAAKALVDSGLWDRTVEGFLFHDWDNYQPSRDEVEERRADHARRQAAYRDRLKTARKQAEQGGPPPVTHSLTLHESVTGRTRDASRDTSLTPSRDTASDASRDALVTTAVTPARPDPTRPDPSVVPKGTTTEQKIKNPPAKNAVALTADTPITAQSIVGEWIDRCPVPPPERTKGQLARNITNLITRDGYDPALVRRAVAEWHRRGIGSPAALPNVLHEVANHAADTRPRSGAPRASTTDQRVQTALDLAASYDTKEPDHDPR